MAEALTTRRWGFRALYLLVSLFTMALALLPLGDGTARLPGPDLPVVIAFVWILRRPDYVPPLLLGAVVLLGDAVEMRPLGLWAAIIVLAGEVLRRREATTRDMPFLGEWALVASVFAGATLVYSALLSLFMVPQPGLGPLLLRALASALAYPPAVALSALLFGLRRAAPGEVDALGHRL